SACLLLGAEVGELVAELLDAAAEVVDALLRAGVERMRLAGAFELHQRQFATVFHLDRLARLQTRPGDELETVAQVLETDLTVVGMDAFFHSQPLFSSGSHAAHCSALAGGN